MSSSIFKGGNGNIRAVVAKCINAFLCTSLHAHMYCKVLAATVNILFTKRIIICVPGCLISRYKLLLSMKILITSIEQSGEGEGATPAIAQHGAIYLPIMLLSSNNRENLVYLEYYHAYNAKDAQLPTVPFESNERRD